MFLIESGILFQMPRRFLLVFLSLIIEFSLHLFDFLTSATRQKKSKENEANLEHENDLSLLI